MRPTLLVLHILILLLFIHCSNGTAPLSRLAPTETDDENFFASIRFQNQLEQAKDENKPILIYFNGYGCVNCRKLDEGVLREKKFQDFLKKHFSIIVLFVDDRTKLPQEARYRNDDWGLVKTIGSEAAILQIELTQSGSQPLFAIFNKDLEHLTTPTGYNTPERFKGYFYDFIDN